MTQKTALSVMGIMGRVRSFLAKESAYVPQKHITAGYRDYLLRVPPRGAEVAVVDVDTTEFFMLISDTHYLLISDTHKLYLSDAVEDAATYVVNAQFRDYMLTAPKPDNP